MATGGDRKTGYEGLVDSFDDDATRETVSLLLDEVARLEAELRARDEAGDAPPSWDIASPPIDEGMTRRIDELTAELAVRDETIGILLEQTQAFEEAADAQRAEWEQLSRWVEEVEQRVSERVAEPSEIEGQVEVERRQAIEDQRRFEADRRAWEVQRRQLEAECTSLRNRAQPVSHPDLEALEAENRELRAACIELEQQAIAPGELELLRQRQEELLRENDILKAELRRERDERARERNESEAALAALRSERARAALAEPAAPRMPQPETRDGSLEADERIRAFRQHLRELHEREAAERATRGIASRLSRLWRSTAPG
ncbi:MAG: hypothetical protein U0794_04375 [Isosphaeraceae bacterium]